MDVLITDVTVMHNEMYCVAGWDPAGNRMVRPLPGGHHWSGALLTQHGVIPGVTIRVQRNGEGNGVFPHKTEDMPIEPASIRLVSSNFAEWTGRHAPAVAASVRKLLGGTSNRIARLGVSIRVFT